MKETELDSRVMVNWIFNKDIRKLSSNDDNKSTRKQRANPRTEREQQGDECKQCIGKNWQERVE